MKLREIVQQAIEMQGIATIKGAAKKAGVSLECMRMVLRVHTAHIPKDNTLIRMANNLGLDPKRLILAAHREILSEFGDNEFLAPLADGYEKKRVWPLSQEQCHYLEKILNSIEIKLIRKYRQVSTEGQVQINGYVDFMFTSHRSKPPSGQD